MTARDTVQAIVVTLLWALCFPLIDVAVADAPPLLIGGGRALIAGVTLLALAQVQKRPRPDARTMGAVAIAGLGLTTLGFGGMFLAGGRISPGVATVIANVQPLIAALLGAFLLQERIFGRRGLALVIGFAGIVATAWPTLLGNSGNSSPAGIGFVLMGALGVAGGNVMLKSIARRVDPIVATGWQLMVGSVPLLVLAAAIEPSTRIQLSPRFLATLGILALFGTALVSVLWLDLLRRNELVRVNVYTFLTPLFALAIAAAFFGERLVGREWVGVGLVLAAVVLISTDTTTGATRKASATCDASTGPPKRASAVAAGLGEDLGS